MASIPIFRPTRSPMMSDLPKPSLPCNSCRHIHQMCWRWKTFEIHWKTFEIQKANLWSSLRHPSQNSENFCYLLTVPKILLCKTKIHLARFPHKREILVLVSIEAYNILTKVTINFLHWSTLIISFSHMLFKPSSTTNIELYARNLIL